MRRIMVQRCWRARLAPSFTLALFLYWPTLIPAGPPDNRPFVPGFNSYFGSPGAIGSPSGFIYPQPGVYAGRVFNPFGTPGIPLTAATGSSPRFLESVAGVALVEVHLPANAQLWIDGQPTKQSGPVREFATPAVLQQGLMYRYTLRAQWDEGGRPVVRERPVEFQSGSRLIVDFTRPDAPPARDGGPGR